MKYSSFKASARLICGVAITAILLAGCGGAAETTQPAAVSNTPTAQPATQGGISSQPASAGAPQIYDFSACVDVCNGSNGMTTFPAGTNTINITWKYKNIAQGVHYIRQWTHAQRGEWKTYDCAWDKPSSGTIAIRFFDTRGGLAAGVWTLTMKVNDVVLLQEKLTIEGNNSYWLPQTAPINACF